MNLEPVRYYVWALWPLAVFAVGAVGMITGIGHMIVPDDWRWISVRHAEILIYAVSPVVLVGFLLCEKRKREMDRRIRESKARLKELSNV